MKLAVTILSTSFDRRHSQFTNFRSITMNNFQILLDLLCFVVVVNDFDLLINCLLAD